MALGTRPGKVEIEKSFYEVWRSFVGAVQAAHKLAPCAVIVLAIVMAGVTWVALLSAKLMVGVVLLLVLTVAVIVYASTEKYGEAALALVAGLLTAYSVTWTAPRFIAFVAVWSAFSFLALLIASVKIAARSESIYREAAIAYAPDVSQAHEVEVRLRSIGDESAIQGIGPIERAEAIRLFVFRKVPIEVMPSGLKAVAMLSVIMQLPSMTVASFVADVYRVFDASHPAYGDLIVDLVYRTIRESPAAPVDFITAFQYSRRLALSRSMDAFAYFAALQAGLEAGVPPEAMTDHLVAQATLRPGHSDPPAAPAVG